MPTAPVVDAWIQHPNPGFLAHPMFASLRRWMGAGELPDAFPIELTVGALEAAGVGHALVSAWHGRSLPPCARTRSCSRGWPRSICTDPWTACAS